MALINETKFASLKSAISEGGHASAETIGARLLWSTGKLVTWLEHRLSIGTAEREALTVIQSRGINCSYQDYTENGQSLKLSPGKLNKIGRLLYGDRWQSQLARSLGVTQGLISSCVSGLRSLPPRHVPTLRRLIAARIASLRAINLSEGEGGN